MYHHTAVMKEWRDVAQEVHWKTIHKSSVNTETVYCSFTHIMHHEFIIIIIISKSKFAGICMDHISSYCDTESDWTVCNVSFVNERQQIIWRHAQTVVSLRALYKFVNFLSVEHVLPLKNAISPIGFDPGTSRIVSHRATNWVEGDLH
jgi:hypothetical protein